MKKRVPFLVLALMASAATGQATTQKPKTEKTKPSATASAKRKTAQNASDDPPAKKITTSKAPAVAEKTDARLKPTNPASEAKPTTAPKPSTPPVMPKAA